ncbi:MAG TPA: DUF3892 domain-containing protein [Bryobacterales bacterium]|nr:DUF3892 domain-containing protein [Bryobacterales bacterium]
MIYNVTCQVPDDAALDRRMEGIGGYSWYKTVDEVVRCISNYDVFYVMVAGRRVRVVVRQHPDSKRYYIATEADSYPDNNLLGLPRCPGR